jgi:hypothetical protein
MTSVADYQLKSKQFVEQNGATGDDIVDGSRTELASVPAPVEDAADLRGAALTGAANAQAQVDSEEASKTAAGKSKKIKSSKEHKADRN